MHFSLIASALALPLLVVGEELPKDPVIAAKMYDNGKVHNEIMAKKYATWDRERQAGKMDSRRYPPINDVVKCINGTADARQYQPLANVTDPYVFRCNNIDLYHFLSHSDLGSTTGEGSSSWGWTSPEGREFIAIGQADGAAFAEINAEGKLVYLGRLPHNSVPAIWREIRGYKNYIVIGSEAVGHNIQIFDMSKLVEIDPATPKTFNNLTDLTGQFTDLPIGRTHNVVVNEETDFAYSVGAQPRNSSCASGLIFIDLKDVSNPTSPGCNAQDGYVHDAQCVVYRGPQEKFLGHEICYGYNEDTLTIYDVTNKANSTVLSRLSYTGANYTHQGWVVDKNWQTRLLMDDEYDEVEKEEPAADGHPVTYIWDISDLEHPINRGYFKNQRAYSIDHNQYIVDGHSYQSNYGSGLAVLDVRSVFEDPTGAGIKEIGYFDIFPEDDNLRNGGIIDFVGTWSSYAYFESGHIFINTMERGGFVVKLQSGKPAKWSFMKK